MKKLVVLVGLVFLFSCRKDDTVDANKFAGTYHGDVQVYVNGNLDHTILNHTLIVHPATVGDFAISNNVITLSTAPIRGNALVFDRTRVGAGPSVNIYEYGTGTFVGDTLRLELYQDRLDAVSNAVLRSDKYLGKLVRQ
jgi:hypothetical protein